MRYPSTPNEFDYIQDSNRKHHAVALSPSAVPFSGGFRARCGSHPADADCPAAAAAAVAAAAAGTAAAAAAGWLAAQRRGLPASSGAGRTTGPGTTPAPPL